MNIIQFKKVFYALTAFALLSGSSQSVLGLPPSVPAAEEPSVAALKQGVYYGYIAVHGQTTKIPFTVEIIKTNELEKESGYRYHRALAKLSLGGFDSFEYTAQDYRIYTHTHFALELSHRGNEHNILSLIQTNVSTDGLTITGQIESPFMSILGSEVKLVYQGEQTFEELKLQLDAMFPERSLVSPITGEYEGNCHGKRKRLQLYAARGAARNGQLLEGFSIQGRYGLATTEEDHRYAAESFISNSAYRSHIREVSYNYFTNVIQLPTFGSNCKMAANRFICDAAEDDIRGKCSLLRKTKTIDHIADALIAPAGFIKPFNEYAMGPGKTRQPSGDFKVETSLEGFAQKNFLGGFLDHSQKPLRERLLFTADINTFVNPETGEQGKKLTLRGKLFLGKDHHDIAPYLDIRFPTLHYFPDENGTITLVGEEFITVMNNFNTKKVTGQLYAKNFGFIGSFTLDRLAEVTDFEDLSCQSPPLHGTFLTHQFNQYGDYIDVNVNTFLMPASSKNADSMDSFFLYKLNGSYTSAVFHKRYVYPNGTTITERGSKMVSFLSHFDPFTRVFYTEFSDQASLFGIHTERGFSGFLSEPESETWSVEEMIQYRFDRAR